MKQLYILILCFSASLAGMAQSAGSAKLYGFKQEVVGGKAPSRPINENGKAGTAATSADHNYFIYLGSQYALTPVEIWINGHPYKVQYKSVSTPVERQDDNNSGQKKIRLVPKTTMRVLMLTPAPFGESKPSLKGKELAANNELVVVYKQNGKLYYQALKSMEPIEAALRQ